MSDRFEDLIELLGLQDIRPRVWRPAGESPENQDGTAKAQTAAAATPPAAVSRGEEILAEAEQEAEAILAEAARQAAEMREIGRREGHQAGYEAGLAEGREKARQEAEELVRKARDEAAAMRAEAEAIMAKAMQEAEKSRQQIVEEAAKDIINLAVAVAERLVRAHLAVDPDVVVRVARDALVASGMSERAVLRVNPLDLGAVQGAVDTLKAAVPQVRELVVEDDPAIPQGSAVVSGQGGVADGRWPVQLDNIRSALERAGKGEG